MADSEIHLRPGVLLIAPPLSDDPNFRRTVVLLCEHGPEGSFGLILNRLLSIQLGEVLEELKSYQDALSLGGPVQPNTLHFLHRRDASIPNAVSVLEDVCWGGDFESVKALVGSGRVDARNLRFFLGYAGWSPSQLEDEITGGGWILAEGDADAVFTKATDRLWRMVLRRKGGEYAVLANFPDDPRMN